MGKTNLFWLLSIVFLFGLIFISFAHVSPALSAANHVVISQIQVAGAGADDEFIELYNPTSADINLAGWFITRRSSGGVTETNLFTTGLSKTISAHGYFLLANKDGVFASGSDLTYASSIASNSTVTLYSDNKVTKVDQVGFGTNVISEGFPIQNPTVGGSIQRKVDDTGGHGLDTDNNLNDFETVAIATPRNSLIIITPTNTPIPSDTPTNTPTENPTNTPTNTPTESPTFTPTPTETPTPTPTPTETPTPISTETPTPTPTLTITPTLTPIPTPTPGRIIIPQFKVVCTTTPMVFRIMTLRITFPFLSCKLVKLN